MVATFGRFRSIALALGLIATFTTAALAERTLAVIPKGTTHEFWKSIHAGATKAAKELDVKIIWKGPQREDDREMQIQVVEDFIFGSDLKSIFAAECGNNARLDVRVLREPLVGDLDVRDDLGQVLLSDEPHE